MGGKKGGNKGSGGNKSKKTLNKVQQRFKQRESQGLSGLTGLKKGTEKKGKNSTLGIYRQYQSDSIRGRAGNQEAAARAAERDREVAEIKANTRAKNLASGTDRGVTTQQNVNQWSDSFTGLKGLETFQNFGYRAPKYKPGYQMRFGIPYTDPGRAGSWGKIGNYFDKGVNQRLGNEARVGFGTAFADDLSQMGKFRNPRTGKLETGLFGTGIPKNFNQLKQTFQGEGGFGFSFGKGADTGPTGITRMAVRRLLPYAGQIGLGRDIFNYGGSEQLSNFADNTIGKINPWAGTTDQSPELAAAAAARLRGPQMNLFGMKIPELGFSEFMGLNTVDRTQPTGLNIGNVEAGAASEEGRNARSIKSKALGVLDSFTSDAFDFDGLGKDKMPDSMKGLVNVAGALQQNPIRQTKDAYNAIQNLNQKATPGDEKAIKNQMKILTQNLGNPDSPLAPINRGWKAFTTDDPNIKGFGEFGQDLRDTFTPGAPGLSPKEIGGKGSTLIEKFGKNLIANNLTNIVTEGDKSAGIEAGSTRNIGDLWNLSQRIRENVKDPESISGKASQNIQKLTGQGTQAPTAGTILNRYGGRKGSSGGASSRILSPLQTGGQRPAEIPLIEPTLKPISQTGTDNKQLQNLQQQSYLNTLMMIQNDPRFIYARGTPRSFSRSFNRRYF